MKEILFETDPSGKYSKSDYLKKNHIDLYNDIIIYAEKNNIADILFKEKVYCYKYNILPPICKNPICNNKVQFRNSTIGYEEYCSNKCIGTDPIIQKRKEEKSLKKFGTKTPAESQIIKEKMIQTNNKKYGSNSPLQNNEIHKKSQQTLMNNYGVDSPLKSKEIQSKRLSHFDIDKWRIKFEATMMSKYGVKNALQNKEIMNKTRETNIKRYNCEYPSQNKEIIKKILSSRNEKDWQDNLEKNMLNLYGVKNSMGVKSFRDKISITQRNKEKKINPNIIDIDLENKQYIMRCDCGQDHDFSILFSLYKSRKFFASNYCTVCFPPHKNSISQLETELFNFIEDNYKDEIILNKKSIIPPYELDIYLPEIKIAFEFNGVYWHNELNKPENYHKMKSDLCDKKNIQLIHIYEDDWVYKKDIVKSIILNKIGKTLEKIYARKTTIEEIDNKQLRIFLSENHLQGYVNSKINIGLSYNNELISVMTFGKKRKSMNSNSAENEYEMLRFCNKLNINVVGGASKLFNYFIKKYNPKEIISYADRSHSNGNLYKQLKFNYIGITEPNYYYVVDDIRKHRFGFRKDVLIKQGFDKDKSEHDIMLERKIYRIYNSGNYKFIYNNKNIK
jgi:hypothetical protein